MKEYSEHLIKREKSKKEKKEKKKKKEDKNQATDCGTCIFFFDILVPLTVASMEV